MKKFLKMLFVQNIIRLSAYKFLLVNSRALNVNSPQYAKRWVAPTLRELLNRRKKFKTNVFTSRNTFPEWNYNAEIFAFGKRLNENFDIKQLQTAFVDSSYIAQEEIRQKDLEVETPLKIENNKYLVAIGEKRISEYVQSYLFFSLPKCSKEGISQIFDWLTSEKMLANISLHIGTKDLILCANNTPTQRILRDAFVAVVGALSESMGEEKVYDFVRDFICTQLNQKDIIEILHFDNVWEKLENLCKEKEIGKPEPRLLGENATKTVLASYFVGVYENKKIIGKGFGESIDVAIEAAATDALLRLYGVVTDQLLFDFELQLENKNEQKSLQEKCL